MIRLNIEPFDLLLFRDGRPFDMGDSASSLPFPSPLTFQGAVRAKLWKFKEEIPPDWLDPTEPPFKFYGPFFEKDGKLLFPLHRSLLDIGPVESSFIKPGYCNLRDLKIKKIPWQKGEEEGARGFISIDDFKEYLLNGNVRGKIMEEVELWKVEERVSIKIDPDLYTVSEEDALFSVGFMRLEKGVRFAFFIEGEEKIREYLEREPRALILGGERRPVRYELVEEDFKQMFEDLKEKIEEKVKERKIMKVIFLTPSIPKGGFIPKSLAQREIITAYIPKPMRLGGWDYKSNEPRPMRYALSPGSTFWVEGRDVSEFWLNFHSDDYASLGLGLTIVGVGDGDVR